ncbi:MAG: PilZ domain-containing protein [Myxococcales bacterium]|nr:PilZ domain-containing protein [Myxococcales bacterium]
MFRSEPADHRRAARRALTVTAEIRERGRGGLALPLDLAEVSEAGAFIASDLLLPVGLELDVAFPIPGGRRVEAQGTVVRVDEQVGSAGMGLRFEQISDADRATLRAFAAA